MLVIPYVCLCLLVSIHVRSYTSFAPNNSCSQPTTIHDPKRLGSVEVVRWVPFRNSLQTTSVVAAAGTRPPLIVLLLHKACFRSIASCFMYSATWITFVAVCTKFSTFSSLPPRGGDGNNPDGGCSKLTVPGARLGGGTPWWNVCGSCDVYSASSIGATSTIGAAAAAGEVVTL